MTRPCNFRSCVPALAGMIGLSIIGSGCSNKSKPLYPVQGHVFFEGSPIPHALVILHPMNTPGTTDVKPRAIVGTDGCFKVFTEKADDGAAPGDYAVTVQWRRQKLTPEQRKSPEERKKNRDLTQKMDASFPSRYQNPQTSGLRIHVAEGSNDLPPFFLKK